MAGLTDILRTEHAVLREALEILEASGQRLARGEPVEGPAAVELVELIIQFGDREHHAKEETELFPALVAAGLPARHGPVAVMLFEHTRGRELVARLLREARGIGTSQDAEDSFAVAALEYAQLLSAHMLKEDGLLFPLAERMVGQERQDQAVVAFARLDEGRPSGGPAAASQKLAELRTRLSRPIAA